MSTRKRKFWGWGYEDGGPSQDECAAILAALSQRFGHALEAAPAPRVEEIELAAPRVPAPRALAPLLRDDPEERLGHTYGKAYRDIIRALRRDFRNAPDWVALPRDEDDIVAILDWCNDARLAAIPYGGGSSVMGGTEARPKDLDGRYAGAVSIDLRRLDRVLEIDRSSRAARIQAGVLGPALEDQLRPQGLTLRHFPQSFEVSSLGGWIATRSGGHFATLYTHIDDFVESLRVVTPAGRSESRRLPGSGAGPSHDRLFIGSEGTLGVITEAWMRLQDRPRFRSSVAVRFPGGAGFFRAAECIRRLSQSGLYPSNCRLLDATEARNSGATTEDESVVLVAFESADHPVDAWTSRALELCRDAGGLLPDTASTTLTGEAGARDGAAGAWRNAFLNLPYVRDTLARASLVVDTFETSITWDRFESFHEQVIRATRDALKRVCGQGSVACRVTHVYPDGPAPSDTIHAPGRPGDELEQWDEIKAAAGDAVIAAGGTITHHHAVGRDHRPWYDQQISPVFAATLRAAKAELDPGGVLNPGVLIDPR